MRANLYQEHAANNASCLLRTCCAQLYLLSGGVSEHPDEAGVLLDLEGVAGALLPFLGTQ